MYKLAAQTDPKPSGVAYHGIGTSIEASISQSTSADLIWTEQMEKAVKAYREAVKTGDGLGSNGEVLFHLAVALEVSSFVCMLLYCWILLFSA